MAIYGNIVQSNLNTIVESCFQEVESFYQSVGESDLAYVLEAKEGGIFSKLRKAFQAVVKFIREKMEWVGKLINKVFKRKSIPVAKAATRPKDKAKTVPPIEIKQTMKWTKVGFDWEKEYMNLPDEKPSARNIHDQFQQKELPKNVLDEVEAKVKEGNGEEAKEEIDEIIETIAKYREDVEQEYERSKQFLDFYKEDTLKKYVYDENVEFTIEKSDDIEELVNQYIEKIDETEKYMNYLNKLKSTLRFDMQYFQNNVEYYEDKIDNYEKYVEDQKNKIEQIQVPQFQTHLSKMYMKLTEFYAFACLKDFEIGQKAVANATTTFGKLAKIYAHTDQLHSQLQFLQYHDFASFKTGIELKGFLKDYKFHELSLS